jgi:type II secretory pathway pseudopilin PulG
MTRHTPRGYALIMALILVAVASFAAGAAVYRAGLDARRDREDDLLFAGGQIRAAIASYRDNRPSGAAPQYPAHLEDLLEDRRFPNPVRHLRRLYADPMTGEPDWVLERYQERIVGVHSRSSGAPLRHAGFQAEDAAFARARSYADWHFTAAKSAGTATRASPDTAAQAMPAVAPQKPLAPEAGAESNADPSDGRNTDTPANPPGGK